MRRIALLPPAALDLITVLLGCAIFLYLTTHQISAPGFYYDEALDAVPAMQIVQGQPTDLLNNAGLDLFGRRWPLMLLDYQGIISTYLLVPFFLIGGINVYAVRAMPIAAGVLAILLTYVLGRLWFDRGTGRIAALLLAVSPSWIFWSRIGVYVVSEIVPFTVGALIALTLWWRGRGAGWLWLGAFLLGLDLSTKLLGLWPLVAVLGVLILLEGRRLLPGGARVPKTPTGPPVPDAPRSRTIRSALRSPAWIGAVVAYALGAFPFLLYNLETRGSTLRELRHSLFQSRAGVTNTTILPNLWEEVDRFKVLLDGGYFWFQGWAGAVYTDPLVPVAFVAATLGLLGLTVRLLPRTAPLGPRAALLAQAGQIPILLLTLVVAFAPTRRLDWIILLPFAGTVLVAGGLWLAALRAPERWLRAAAWHLLGAGVLAGAVWWLTGNPTGQTIAGPFDLRATDVAGGVFWLALGALLLLLGWSRPAHRWQRPLVATLGFIAAILVQSFSTLSGLWVTHLLVILPLPQILIGAGLMMLWRVMLAALVGRRGAALPRPARIANLARQMSLALVPTLLLLAALLVGELRTVADYHADLARTGGSSAFSDAIYDLSDYVNAQPADRAIVAGEWGIRRQIQILSQGRVNPPEIFQYDSSPDPPPAFYQALTDTLRLNNPLYLFTARDLGPDHRSIGPYDRFPAFQAALAAQGLEPVMEHQSVTRFGEPVYRAYGVRQRAAARP